MILELAGIVSKLYCKSSHLTLRSEAKMAQTIKSIPLTIRESLRITVFADAIEFCDLDRRLLIQLGGQVPQFLLNFHHCLVTCANGLTVTNLEELHVRSSDGKAALTFSKHKRDLRISLMHFNRECDMEWSCDAAECSRLAPTVHDILRKWAVAGTFPN